MLLVLKVCEEYLLDIVNKNNAIELYLFADRYSALKLKEHAYYFIHNQVYEIPTEKAIQSLHL